jgi:hypothetical protein
MQRLFFPTFSHKQLPKVVERARKRVGAEIDARAAAEFGCVCGDEIGLIY